MPNWKGDLHSEPCSVERYTGTAQGWVCDAVLSGSGGIYCSCRKNQSEDKAGGPVVARVAQARTRLHGVTCVHDSAFGTERYVNSKCDVAIKFALRRDF
jgi:hypothetical protein